MAESSKRVVRGNYGPSLGSPQPRHTSAPPRSQAQRSHHPCYPEALAIDRVAWWHQALTSDPALAKAAPCRSEIRQQDAFTFVRGSPASHHRGRHPRLQTCGTWHG